jgi:hypothetical protein
MASSGQRKATFFVVGVQKICTGRLHRGIQRGCVDDQDIAVFTNVGFTRNTVLDVILVVAASTITNYTGSVTQPLLEQMFQEHAWKA